MTGQLLTAPERYVTNVELAQHMRVSTSTIKRWLRAGCPSHTWGMKRTRRYLISEVEVWLEQREAGTVTADNNHMAGRMTPTWPERNGK
jgi:hypothetical protein